jgi:glycosyltransferase involved in cell wall biosynthesis
MPVVMNILVSLLKYPPEHTGAGLRVRRMYDNLQEGGQVDRLYVLTSRTFAAGKTQARHRRQQIRCVGFNPHEQTPDTRRSGLLKALFVCRAGVATIIHYLRIYKKIDIVHTIDSSWLSTIVAWCARMTGRPLVKEIVLLGADDPLSVSKHKRGLVRFVFLRPFHWARLIVVISSKLADACRTYGIAPQKIWCRFNPVYLPRTPAGAESEAALRAIEPEKLLILSVGRIGHRKNTLFLLQCGFHLRTAAQLVFVGPFESAAYEAQAKALAGKLERVSRAQVSAVFPGHVADRHRLAALYRRAGLFWFASRREGLGNVVIEALLCGTPVVTLPVGGIMREILVDARDGEVVDTERPEVFAAACDRWLTRTDIDRAAIEARARRRFDASAVEAGYVRRFQKLLLPPSGGHP